LTAILADLNTIMVTPDHKKSVIFHQWSIMTLFCTTKTPLGNDNTMSYDS